MTISAIKCAECGRQLRPLPRFERDGLCSACLLRLALDRPVAELESMSTEPEMAPGNGRTAQTRFEGYALLERIGQGAMGIVFKARQVSLNRTVAVKMLLSGALATPAEVRRFRQEAEAAATLRHPNIVAIHEVGEQDGRPFFSMDYIEGQSLSNVINRTPLPAERAARYLQKIAEAIHFAHTHGIVHRDLKPANVLIDANDQPHITDFGLARQIEIESDLTLTGVALGTPSYMPPEQAAGCRHKMGPQSDIYSLGAILYDLVTGRPPFRADTAVDTLRQVLDTEPVPPRLLNPKVPRDLETICLKCLAKEPGARYESAQALSEDLARFLRHEPILARPVAAPARVARWCRRHPVLALSLATIAALLTATSVAGLLFAKNLEQQLKQQILKGNLFAARQAASSVMLRLHEWRREVAAVAEMEHLAKLLREGDSKALQELMKQLLHRNNTGQQTNAFQSWYVEDHNGVLLGAHPLLNPAIIGAKYDGRDYFRGAMSHAAQGFRGISAVHFSKAFQADNDTLIKFAISAPVHDGRAPDAPILGMIAATVAASSTLDLFRLDDERSNVLLLGRWDPNPASGPPKAAGTDRYHILFSSEPGMEKVPVTHRVLAVVHRPECGTDELRSNLAPTDLTPEQCVDPDYVDRSGRKWLAAFAGIGSTEYVISVQTPLDEVSELNRRLAFYLAISGCAALGFAGVIGGGVFVVSVARQRGPAKYSYPPAT